MITIFWDSEGAILVNDAKRRDNQFSGLHQDTDKTQLTVVQSSTLRIQQKFFMTMRALTQSWLQMRQPLNWNGMYE